MAVDLATNTAKLVETSVMETPVSKGYDGDIGIIFHQMMRSPLVLSIFS